MENLNKWIGDAAGWGWGPWLVALLLVALLVLSGVIGSETKRYFSEPGN